MDEPKLPPIIKFEARIDVRYMGVNSEGVAFDLRNREDADHYKFLGGRVYYQVVETSKWEQL